MNILIVDDDKTSRMVLRNILEKRKFEVIEAESAVNAVRILDANRPIDIVIADIMMPEVSGLQLLQHMRNTPKYQDIPVIMCSAQNDRDSVMKAAKLKVSGYIVKPMVATQVLKQVNKVMSQTQPPLEGSKFKVAARLGMTSADYMEILSGFLDDVSKRISQLRQAIADNSGLKIQMLANAIKGSADTLGALGLREAAQKLEEAGQSGELDEAENALARLSAEVPKLREYVGLEGQTKNMQSRAKTNTPYFKGKS